MKLGVFYVEDSTLKEYVAATEDIANRKADGHLLHILHRRRSVIHQRLRVEAGVTSTTNDAFTIELYRVLLKRVII
jgi:hypothetical protein